MFHVCMYIYAGMEELIFWTKVFLMKGHVSELCMLTLQSRKKCDGIFRIPG